MKSSAPEEIRTEALSHKVPIIQDGALSFLCGLIKEKGCKEILELGTAVGYSAIAMASLSEDIHIDTLEIREVFHLPDRRPC